MNTPHPAEGSLTTESDDSRTNGGPSALEWYAIEHGQEAVQEWIEFWEGRMDYVDYLRIRSHIFQ